MSDELIGKYLGQYLITEVIARGGMATVYKATQPKLDRMVAIKVLRHDANPLFTARFTREARAMAALQHHNILPIYDYNDQGGLLYLVLQYVQDGRTLGNVRSNPMETITALGLMRHICEALDYAHKRGIVHRDIKPSNILMPSPDWPMLSDFGIAKLLNETKQQLTMSNQIIGTAAYMAPEQVTGLPVDARTDLYSAAVVLYELLTGRVPFDGDTPMIVWTKHAFEAPPPPRSINPDLPVVLDEVLLRALAKDPNQRYQNAAEMGAELDRVAGQLDLSRARRTIIALYEGGMQAFKEGRWDDAVAYLSRLSALDPNFQDAAYLLAMAREEQQRARFDAQRQIEQARQQISGATERQRDSALDPTIVTPATGTTLGSSARARRPAPPTIKLRREELELEAGTPPEAEAPLAAEAPARARRQTLAWVLVGVVVLALALGLLLMLRRSGGAGAAVQAVGVLMPATLSFGLATNLFDALDVR